ncbi:uncharacterized protein LOC114302664 [Camellia sinensis]|uniref:uncharacterized protein LOC114302664 n=1 Tax=Camellia sinensis TaxID=4442 RepID=UPI00103684C1|nr:uncharacterized protein LOC114302664 [Camellia sinensis]
MPRRAVYKDGAGPSQSAPQPSTIVQITQQVRAELRDKLREELREEMRAEVKRNFTFGQHCETVAYQSKQAQPGRVVRERIKPKLSLLSLPSTYTPLKGLKPSRSSTIRVFAAPEVLDSQETLDGPDSATTEFGGSVDPGSSPLSIGVDAETVIFSPFMLCLVAEKN